MPDGSKSLTYGELTRGEALVKNVAGDPPFTPATEWKIAGTPVPKANGRDFVTGKHQFPSDIVRPGDDVWRGAAAGGLQRNACNRLTRTPLKRCRA